MPDTLVNVSKDQLSEMKVSGHTMTLDPGLYCIFSMPEGPVPDPETGLPVVRISAAPGRRAEKVELLGLDPNGWIGPEAATLVRVTQARSNLLVTVYQSSASVAEAPQLQVVRISSAAQAEPVPDPARQTTSAGAPPRLSEPEVVEIVAHIYGRGDVGVHAGIWAGEPGSKRWIEGFGIAGIGEVPESDIEYQAVLGRGWLSPWSPGGQFCGSRGMSLPILGLRVRLIGASATTHRVVLSATFVDGSKVGPVAGDEPCQSPSLAALEAFQIVIEPIEAKAVAPSPSPEPAAKPAPAAKAVPKAAAKLKAATKTATKAATKAATKVGAQMAAPVSRGTLAAGAPRIAASRRR